MNTQETRGCLFLKKERAKLWGTAAVGSQRREIKRGPIKKKKKKERPHQRIETRERGRGRGRARRRTGVRALGRLVGKEIPQGQGEGRGNQLDGCTVAVSPKVRTMGLGAVANYRGPGVWSRIQEHPNYCCALS